jgi:hypothetical protein
MVFDCSDSGIVGYLPFKHECISAIFCVVLAMASPLSKDFY